MENDQKPPTENYCICTWRALKKILCPNPEELDLKKRSFFVNSNGVLVKFIINKSEKGEKAMREYAELTAKFGKIPYELIKMKRLKILSKVVHSEYVNSTVRAHVPC